jgi:hypothetical protein
MICPICNAKYRAYHKQFTPGPGRWNSETEGLWQHVFAKHYPVIVSNLNDVLCACGARFTKCSRFGVGVHLIEHLSQLTEDQHREHVILFQLGATIEGVPHD